jgi:glutathione peroxidase
MAKDTLHKYSINTPRGTVLDLAQFEGKAILAVNTATQCGLTPQFKGLEELHQKYKDQGLVVLGFPCNQFLGQEPLKDAEMEQQCEINHGVTFQLTEKIKVNGPATHPVFKYLKSAKGGFLGSAIKWNFTKFLINAKGEVIERYSPQTEPKDIEVDLKRALPKKA